MSLAAGRLRHRVSLQERLLSQDEHGNPVFTWREVCQLWAAVEPLSVRDLIAAQAQQSGVSVRVVIRYRENINPQMRIVYRGKFYSIRGIQPDADSGLEYLTILASEGVSEG